MEVEISKPRMGGYHVDGLYIVDRGTVGTELTKEEYNLLTRKEKRDLYYEYKRKSMLRELERENMMYRTLDESTKNQIDLLKCTEQQIKKIIEWSGLADEENSENYVIRARKKLEEFENLKSIEEKDKFFALLVANGMTGIMVKNELMENSS